MEYDQVYDGDEAVTVDPKKYSEYANGIYPFVQFDAFFLRDLDNNGEADGVRGTCNKVGKQDTLYIELRQLTNGYIKDGATITINGEAGKERNFYLESAIVKDNEIKENCIGNDISTITLNQIGNKGNGVQKLLTGIVKSGDYTYESKKTDAIGNNIENYSKENSITFKGIHVRTNDDGSETEIPIEKTVTFNVDWYGEVKTEIPQYLNNEDNIRQNGDIEKAVDETNNELKLEFTIGVQEVNNQLILSKSYIEGNIPQLNGYNPKKVEITGTNISYTYEPTTRKFTAQREATLNEEKTQITTVVNNGTNSSKRYNKYTLKVIYDLEAYKTLGEDATIEYRVPVSAYYEGYNNNTGNFKNPHKSNIAQDTFVITFRRINGNKARFDVYVGEYMSNPTRRYVVSKKKPLRMYNEVSEGKEEDYYTVIWHADIGTAENQKVIMRETENKEDGYTSDQFLKANDVKDSMEDVSSFIGIYFSDPTNMLGKNGEIKVYDDETEILLETFNKDNWNKYTKTTPYRYKMPVKHIRIETSNINKNSALSVYHIKELDDEAILKKYTKDDFDSLIQIQSTLAGYLEDTESEHINTDTHFADYETPISVANINASKTAISTQETEENFEIKIQTEASEYNNEEKWINGAFLLKMPKDIIDVEINSVNIDNGQVTLTSYEDYEEEIAGEQGAQDIYKFIKINTENKREASYTITVDCNITPDPRIATTTEKIELYAYNENNPNYYYSGADTYDVNDNLNKTDQVNKREIALSLVSPNSLLTSQVASNYDTKGSTAVAPQKAIVSKEQQKATVTIEINNNYTNEISYVKIIGKVPKKSNTYVINGTDMGSVFNAELTGPITLPQGLQEGTKIYYSYEDNVTKEITDEASQWKEAGTEEIDYSKVKSFLIDFQERKLAHEEKHKISYEIKLPEGLQYNEVSYSHHAIYFSLETENGRYKTQTEPNKLGFMVAKRYDLELTKYQLGQQKVVAGATYSITELQDGNEQNEIKTRVTLADGKFTLKDLYLDRTYVVKEIKSPNEYELNKDEIKFRVTEADGKLQVEKLSNLPIGEDRGTIQQLKMQKTESGDSAGNKGNEDKLVLVVQDEVKANLVITKLEKKQADSLASQAQVPVTGARFKLTGGDLPETGKIITSNSIGKINIKGLEIGEEYTLEEVKAEGYYLANQVKFKITHGAEQDYNIEIIEPAQGKETPIKQDTVTLIVNENKIPEASFTMEDEKIPTYNLTIKKIEKGKPEVLISGVKFKLIKDGEELGRYETGKIAGTEQDGEVGQVTIENLYAYEEVRGIEQTYMLQETFAPEGYSKVKDIEFKVTKEDGNFSLEIMQGTILETQIDGNNITITIEDNPSFKLTKQEAKEESAEPKLLPDTKFVIYNVENGDEPARNSKGELVGTKEIIDGKEYNVLTTDSKGEITADLPQGLYKAVEVKASDEKYVLAGETYFGIGASREGIKDLGLDWAKGVGETGSDSIYSVASTSDGGIIAGGVFTSSSINLGEGVNREDVIVNNNGSNDGLIIKYREDGKVEWAKVVGGSSSDSIQSVASTSDGGIIAGGFFYSSSINLGKREDGEEVIENNYSGSDPEGLIIKYNSEGKVSWEKVIKGVYIKSLASTSDGGIIAGGYFDLYSINLGEGEGEDGKEVVVYKHQKYNTPSYRDSYRDGLIIKYNSEGKVSWAKGIGDLENEYINSVASTSDGGIIAGGYFHSSSINLGKGTDENDVTVKNKTTNKNYDDGLIIKYRSDGVVEWAKVVGGSINNDCINSVASTRDGGIIVGGNCYGNILAYNINLGEGEDGEDVVVKCKGGNDGIIIKYNAERKNIMGKCSMWN